MDELCVIDFSQDLEYWMIDDLYLEVIWLVKHAVSQQVLTNKRAKIRQQNTTERTGGGNTLWNCSTNPLSAFIGWKVGGVKRQFPWMLSGNGSWFAGGPESHSIKWITIRLGMENFEIEKKFFFTQELNLSTWIGIWSIFTSKHKYDIYTYFISLWVPRGTLSNANSTMLRTSYWKHLKKITQRAQTL